MANSISLNENLGSLNDNINHMICDIIQPQNCPFYYRSNKNDNKNNNNNNDNNDNENNKNNNNDNNDNDDNKDNEQRQEH